MAVRSLMAQEKNMSASQPHSFLLRSLYHIFLYSSSAISSVFFTEYLFTDVCPSNGILPMLRISNRKNLQPEL